MAGHEKSIYTTKNRKEGVEAKGQIKHTGGDGAKEKHGAAAEKEKQNRSTSVRCYINRQTQRGGRDGRYMGRVGPPILRIKIKIKKGVLTPATRCSGLRAADE